MAFQITFSPEALEDLRDLRAYDRAAVADAIDEHLTHKPTRESRSRIKRLRGMSQPQYRLRVGDVRVFYDVVEDQVAVLGIVAKADADGWLRDRGVES